MDYQNQKHVYLTGFVLKQKVNLYEQKYKNI